MKTMPRTRSVARPRIGGRVAYPSLLSTRTVVPTFSTEDISDTSIRLISYGSGWAILGRTDVIADQLEALGCYYNRALKAWIIPNDAVRQTIISFYSDYE